MAEGEWVEAISRWKQVLDRFGPASSWSAYRGLIVAYTNRGRIGTAEAVASRARVVFPKSVELAVAQAELPMVEKRWQEAADRWQAVLDEFGPAASWKPYEGLTRCYEAMGDIATAVDMAAEGLRRFPDTPEPAVTWAQMAMVTEDWTTAIARWEELLDRFEPNVPWKVYLRLAITRGRHGDLTLADEALQRGMVHNPGSLSLVAHSAELAMAERSWPEALRRWHKLLLAREIAAGEEGIGASFPRRGDQWDWYEEAWQTIVRDWGEIEPKLGFEPTPFLYRALGKTLNNARLPEEGLEILRVGRIAHPEDSWLAFDYAISCLSLLQSGEYSSGLTELRRELENHPLVAELCSNANVPAPGASWSDRQSGRSGLDSVADVHANNLETMATFAPNRSEATDELGSVHIIRLRHGSSTELELKAGRYFSRDIIKRRVRRISERDSWEEMTAPENLIFKRARELSGAFGERFATPPLLTAGDLSDAVLFFLVHEHSLHEPMRRLAADIASESDDSPVFIESPTDKYAYLDGYAYSYFDVLYLYFELRKLGVNAFLCRYYRGKPPVRPTMEFVPGVRSLLPRGDVKETTQVNHRSALIPAGIRSVRRVVDSLDSPLVFSSGAVVKEFAYDRSLRQAFPIEPEASIHPDLTSLPTFTFELWPAATLRGVPLSAEDDLEPHASIEVSQEIGGDWFLWLDRALHGYLAEISANSYAEIAARGIEEAHISDHLFGDAALFASAVKRSGGRVVLWPHSANPVHVNERQIGSFDEVHAVTREGCRRWEERFPDVQVTHSPSTMLDPPIKNSRIDADLPLSVVVIGGRSILRNMPILNQSLHEASFRDFFTGLEDLQTRQAINVYFKPRGHTGEEEMWLSGIVGSTANWDRVLEHPMRIDLPNPLFVSISMGSSALVEGLSRGIPGVVVRDFPVRDYTTLDEKAIPTGTSNEILDVVASCFEPGGYERLLENELRYYAAELETGEPL
jgi:tetratricopeptide (TPR) repeat protein